MPYPAALEPEAFPRLPPHLVERGSGLEEVRGAFDSRDDISGVREVAGVLAPARTSCIPRDDSFASFCILGASDENSSMEMWE